MAVLYGNYSALIAGRPIRLSKLSGMTLADQKRAYEESTIPESKTTARGGLTSAVKVDFQKAHAPLLLTVN